MSPYVEVSSLIFWHLVLALLWDLGQLRIQELHVYGGLREGLPQHGLEVRDELPRRVRREGGHGEVQALERHAHRRVALKGTNE